MEQQYKSVYKPSWIKISFLALGLIGIIFGTYYTVKKVRKPEPKKIYEALVQVVDQKASDPKEDLRSSLKAGDVLIVLPEGQKWSETERISYLILKMNLTEEQAEKITQSEERERKLTAEEEEALKGREDASRLTNPMETVRARAYRIKMEDLNFNVQEFWQDKKQPYPDKVFGWEIVEKKK